MRSIVYLLLLAACLGLIQCNYWKKEEPLDDGICNLPSPAVVLNDTFLLKEYVQFGKDKTQEFKNCFGENDSFYIYHVYVDKCKKHVNQIAIIPFKIRNDWNNFRFRFVPFLSDNRFSETLYLSNYQGCLSDSLHILTVPQSETNLYSYHIDGNVSFDADSNLYLNNLIFSPVHLKFEKK